MLANGIWIMSTPRWCICVCSHDCWCRILPLHWTPLRYEFWVQDSLFPKRCWNCQYMHLFLPVVNTCTIWTCYDHIFRSIFMTGKAVSMEGHITCWIVWWIFGGLPKMFSVFKQCCQHMCLFLDNYCSFCNCNRTNFHELLGQKVNHESWGWVTVGMAMMSAACDGGEIGRSPSKVQPSFVAPESVCWHVSASYLAKPAEEGKDQYRY